jgi:GcrA cell cycle regulator
MSNQHTNPWTPAESSTLADLWRAGNNKRQIAAALGKSHGAVSGRLDLLGLFDESETSAWTPERIEKLKTMWAAGAKSGEIADHLGISRNAVAEKLNKFGLYGADRQAAELLEGQNPACVSLPKPRRVSDDLITAIETLQAHSCRWPIGNPSEDGFRFCGCEKLPLNSYCEAHIRLARPGDPRKGDKAED